MEKLQKALEQAREQRARVVDAPTERMQSKVSNSAERWAGLTPFTPETATLKRNRIVTHTSGHEAAPYDVLRTKIILQMRREGWRRLAITSARSGFGKTTTCCNLLIGLTRQPDIHAIFCELDLRRPSMRKIFATTPPHDITQMLTGEVAFGDQALRVKDNVALSIAQAPSHDPSRFLLSDQTEAQLQTIETQYKPDLMVFDLPPMMAGDDAPAFLSKVDCALIVAQAEKTTVAEIDRSEREIAEHTNVLGVVLNQCRFADTSIGAGYEDY